MPLPTEQEQKYNIDTTTCQFKSTTSYIYGTIITVLNSKNTPIKSELKRKNKPGKKFGAKKRSWYGHGLIKIYTIPTLPNVHIAIR